MKYNKNTEKESQISIVLILSQKFECHFMFDKFSFDYLVTTKWQTGLLFWSGSDQGSDPGKKQTPAMGPLPKPDLHYSTMKDDR